MIKRKTCGAGVLSVAAGALIATAFGVGTVRAEEPVDYVRICDAYGSGYYYIPGTETCLRIRGGLGYQTSWIENTNALGGGTLVYGGGGPQNERFGATFGEWVQRDGLKLGVKLDGDYGDLNIAGHPVIGAYGSYEGAWGDEGYRGSALIGQNNVTQVAFTFLEPNAMATPGIFSNAANVGLQSHGQLDMSWNRINAGVEFDHGSLLGLGGPLDGDEGIDGLNGDFPRLTGRIGVFYEDLNTDALGRADWTFNGAPWVGYYQNYRLDTQDQYFGVRAGGTIKFKPCFDGKLTTSLSADLYLGYHSGEGQYWQQTGVGGGNVVTQSRNYSNDSLALGAGVSVTAAYEFSPGWRLGSKLEWSYLPDVTSFRAPQNPTEQAGAGFYSDDANRFFGTVGITRQF